MGLFLSELSFGAIEFECVFDIEVLCTGRRWELAMFEQVIVRVVFVPLGAVVIAILCRSSHFLEMKVHTGEVAIDERCPTLLLLKDEGSLQVPSLFEAALFEFDDEPVAFILCECFDVRCHCECRSPGVCLLSVLGVVGEHPLFAIAVHVYGRGVSWSVDVV